MDAPVSSEVSNVQNVSHGLNPVTILLSFTSARELTAIPQHSLSIGMYEYRAVGRTLFGDQNWEMLMVYFFFKALPDILRLIGCFLGVAACLEPVLGHLEPVLGLPGDIFGQS